MPHIEIKYSNNLALPIETLFSDLEKAINVIDSSAGACKSCAYPAAGFLHTHVLVKVCLLQKPHRDEAFTQKIVLALSECIQSH